jgi:hypothetical protein
MVAMPSRSASVALAGHGLATRAGVHARPRADGGVRVLSVTPGGLRTCPVSAEPAGATAVNGVSAAHDRATAAGAQPGPYRRLATPLAVSGAAGWRSRLHGGARSTSRGCHDPRVRRAESAGQYSAVMPWPSTTSSMHPAGSYFSGRRRAIKRIPRPTAVATGPRRTATVPPGGAHMKPSWWVPNEAVVATAECPVSAKSVLSHLNRPIVPRVSLLFV